MIVGIGIDMIEVDRVADKISREEAFMRRVFSEREIEYCQAKTSKFEHFAARFAAKEAFLKATGKGLLAGFDLHLIEIVTDTDGRPQIVVGGVYQEMALDHHWKKIHVSMSHLKSVASAMVIIEL